DLEASAAEMVDDGCLLRDRRRIERVELVLGEELLVTGRRRILDVGQEGLERVAIAEVERDHDAMPLALRRAAEIDRLGEARRHRVEFRGRRVRGSADQAE